MRMLRSAPGSSSFQQSCIIGSNVKHSKATKDDTLVIAETLGVVTLTSLCEASGYIAAIVKQHVAAAEPPPGALCPAQEVISLL